MLIRDLHIGETALKCLDKRREYTPIYEPPRVSDSVSPANVSNSQTSIENFLPKMECLMVLIGSHTCPIMIS